MSPWKYSWNGDQVVPVRVGLEQLARRRRPAAGRPRPAGRCSTSRPRQVVGDLGQASACVPDPVGYSTSRSSPKNAAIPPQRLDEQVVDREPDRPAPVGVAAEQPARRLAGLVVDGEVDAPPRSTVNGWSRWPRDSVRSPYGDRNSSSSSIGREDAHQLVAVRPSTAAGCWWPSRTCGLRRRRRRTRGWLRAGTSAAASAKSGSRLRVARAERRGRAQRQQADHRAHPQRHPVARRRSAARRRRSRPRSSHRPLSYTAVGDVGEVLEELRREVLVGRVVLGEDERHLEQVERVHRHPRRCRRSAPARPATGSAADRSNGPMLSSPRKPPSKTLLPPAVLAVDPPGEVEQQLVQHPGQEVVVARRRRSRRPAARPRRAPAGSRRRTPTRTPGSARWGACTTRAAAAAAASLANAGVDVGDRHAVERQVPGGVPGVLPRVRHRDDVGVVQVPPGGVAPVPPAPPAAARAGRVAVEPPLARRSGRTACPTSARRAPAAAPSPRRRWLPAGSERGEERVGLRPVGPPSRRRSRRPSRCAASAGSSRRGQPQPDLARCPPAGTVERVVQRGLGADPVRVDRSARRRTTWSLMPSFGYGERPGTPHSRSALVSLSQNSSAGTPSPVSVSAADRRGARRAGPRRRRRDAAARRRWPGQAPRPGVAEPQRGQHVQGRRVRSAVRHGDPHAQVGRAGLGVVDGHRPVPVVVEDPGVDQLVLRLVLRRGGRSPRPGRRRGTRAAGSGSASASTSASASSRGTTSTP